jgi:hypothetical protein
MVLQMEKNLTIENLRNHSASTVARLRRLLAAGAPATADPSRQGFYELQDDCQVFYIHLRPQTRKVLLLATWHKSCPEAT